jgi:hypothetical protein
LGHLVAQTADMRKAYRIEGQNVVLYLDNAWSKSEQERLLEIAGLKGLSLDTLWNQQNLGRFSKSGWKLGQPVKRTAKIYKPLNHLSGDVKLDKDLVLLNYDKTVIEQTRATFGFNEFRQRSVVTLPGGETHFFLKGRQSAGDVYLSGTFNGWSTLSRPMTKTDSGWVAKMTLPPGKHCYKFIVNGYWMPDPENLHREDDLHGGWNSVYFGTNHIFKLAGFKQADEVILSGSFNNWSKREAKLNKTKTGWEIPVYLKDGVHEYKFIVDKKWITDPANPSLSQNENSVFQLGEPFKFELKGFLRAKEVYLAGNFNNWNPKELKMSRTSTGWIIPYVLSAGNYQYKFIVDGEWIMDPENALTGVEGWHANSLVSIKPNHTFLFKGDMSAREVQLAGNFSDWREYSMKKTPEGWKLELYLPPGKCLYKFIVNGKWILDPANPLWEQNEFDTGNSVLWLDR